MWKGMLLGAILSVSVVVAAHALDVDDIIGMLQAGIGEDVILKAVDASGDTLYLTSDDLIGLKDAGATDWFLDELLSREDRTSSYRPLPRSYYPPYGYYTIGLVYDPFDYYFACYPYYYAYVAPLSFSWSWWYYGGPYHGSWCEPYYGYRVSYYTSRWGTRSVWDRGFRTARYHVPSYAPVDKESSYSVFSRPGTGQTRGGSLQRGLPSDKPADSRVWRRPGGRRESIERPSHREGRSPAWGRSDRPTSRPAPPRNSRPDVRRGQSSRSNPASRVVPSAPPRRAWSR